MLGGKPRHAPKPLSRASEFAGVDDGHVCGGELGEGAGGGRRPARTGAELTR